MKKMKLALIALGSVIGIGSAVAASSPGQYYTSATGSNLVPGQKGTDWDCNPQIVVTCAFLEQTDGSRTKLMGELYLIND